MTPTTPMATKKITGSCALEKEETDGSDHYEYGSVSVHVGPVTNDLIHVESDANENIDSGEDDTIKVSFEKTVVVAKTAKDVLSFVGSDLGTYKALTTA